MNYTPKKPHFCEDFEKAALFFKMFVLHDAINEKLFSSNIFEHISNKNLGLIISTRKWSFKLMVKHVVLILRLLFKYKPWNLPPMIAKSNHLVKLPEYFFTFDQ
jgi:hypothetical protein